MISDDIDFGELDPGVRELVRRLREQNFLTCDSGDGVSKPADERVFDRPHVMIAEAHRLQTLVDSWVSSDEWD